MSSCWQAAHSTTCTHTRGQAPCQLDKGGMLQMPHNQFNILAIYFELCLCLWNNHGIERLLQVIYYLWLHQSKIRVGTENRWQCRCYKNQDYRVGMARADQKVAVLLHQEQNPNKSEVLPTYIWPESMGKSLCIQLLRWLLEHSCGCFVYAFNYLFTFPSLSQVL